MQNTTVVNNKRDLRIKVHVHKRNKQSRDKLTTGGSHRFRVSKRSKTF